MSAEAEFNERKPKGEERGLLNQPLLGLLRTEKMKQTFPASTWIGLSDGTVASGIRPCLGRPEKPDKRVKWDTQ